MFKRLGSFDHHHFKHYLRFIKCLHFKISILNLAHGKKSCTATTEIYVAEENGDCAHKVNEDEDTLTHTSLL